MVEEKESFLWERYKHNVDLHRSYLDLVIKINTFYYAITGAIISFYFLHVKDPLINYSLILPFLMSIGLAVFFFRCALASRLSQKDIENIAERMNIKTYSAVAAVLEFLLWIFFVTASIVAVGLIVLFFYKF